MCGHTRLHARLCMSMRVCVCVCGLRTRVCSFTLRSLRAWGCGPDLCHAHRDPKNSTNQQRVPQRRVSVESRQRSQWTPPSRAANPEPPQRGVATFSHPSPLTYSPFKQVCVLHSSVTQAALDPGFTVNSLCVVQDEPCVSEYGAAQLLH